MATKPENVSVFPEPPEFTPAGTFQPIYGKFDLTTYVQGASDYEIMTFLVGQYNKWIAEYNIVTKWATTALDACKQLQDWVNSWFNNLDVTHEINAKLDQMVANGTFEVIFKNAFQTEINQFEAVTEQKAIDAAKATAADTTSKWLPSNIAGSSEVVIDKSLTVDGACADAKAAGLRYDYVAYYGKAFDINTVFTKNIIIAVNSSTTLTHAPFNDWADGSPWYIKYMYDPNYQYVIHQYFYGNHTKCAYRTYTPETSEWHEWNMYASPCSYKTAYNETLDANNAVYNNITIGFNVSTNLLNAPFDDWKDGATWYMQYRTNGSTAYTTEQIIYTTDPTKPVAWRVFAQQTAGGWNIRRSSGANGSTTITCGKGKDYETLRAGVTAATQTPNTTLVVYPGTYDLTVEFADVISAHSGTGLVLNNGITIEFLAGSYVKAIFDNLDDWVFHNFEPFKCAGDFTLIGANIECKNTRYCVHDEHGGLGTYHNRYINCTMKYSTTSPKSTYVQCIGGGLGAHGFIEISGGVYTSSPTYPINNLPLDQSQVAISYHNGYTSDCDSKIFINNVLLTDKGYFRFGDHGTSTALSQVVISNCKMGNKTVHQPEEYTDTVTNFAITEYNNTIE